MSVTRRINEIKQPRGGFLKVSEFKTTYYSDGVELYQSENIPAKTIGLVVDYLTRFMLGVPVVKAFEISISGISIFNSVTKRKVDYNSFTSQITGLDDASIIAACRLVLFDAFYRNPFEAMDMKINIGTKPNEETICDIRTMIRRTLLFFESLGTIVSTNITFEGGYTDLIATGDADFMTEDTIFDLKVLSGEITAKHTLQVLIYYLLGKNSGKEDFQNIHKIGLFNPRYNKSYIYDLDDCPMDKLDIVKYAVIGCETSGKETVHDGIEYEERLPDDEMAQWIGRKRYTLSNKLHVNALVASIIKAFTEGNENYNKKIVGGSIGIFHSHDKAGYSFDNSFFYGKDFDDLVKQISQIPRALKETVRLVGDTLVDIGYSPCFVKNNIKYKYDRKYESEFECYYVVKICVSFKCNHVVKNIIANDGAEYNISAKRYSVIEQRTRNILNDVYKYNEIDVKEGILVLPDGIKEIPDYCCSEVDNIQQVKFSAGVTVIGEHAFEKCVSLKNIVLTENIVRIGKFAFAKCANVSDLTINASVNKLVQGVFASCVSMVELKLGKPIIEIGRGAFKKCSALKEISFNNTLQIIGKEAFRECIALEKILLPNSVKEIQDKAFAGCANLMEISIPKQCRVASNAFEKCEKAKIIYR